MIKVSITICDKRFVYNKRLCDSELYKEYLDGKQNVAQLAHKYGKSSKTIIRHLEKHKGIVCKRHYNRNVILLMDGTYTSNAFGVLVFKDSITKDILWYKFLTKHETHRTQENLYKVFP